LLDEETDNVSRHKEIVGETASLEGRRTQGKDFENIRTNSRHPFWKISGSLQKEWKNTVNVNQETGRTKKERLAGGVDSGGREFGLEQKTPTP